MRPIKSLINLLFLVYSCSPLNENPNDPIIDDGGNSDAGSTYTSDHPCQYDLMWTDFYNCGACDKVCPLTDSDQCVGGICSCGGHASCPAGSDCLGGKCIGTDPSGLNCEFSEECQAGYRCIEGHCTFYECVPEDCDGLDNDCDGSTDENDLGNPLSEWCFSGRDDQLQLPCRSGSRMCMSDGTWSECFGELPPYNEQGLLGCDGIDNDCDGCVDGVRVEDICESREPDAYDILYIIDISGSMQTKIDKVKAATNNFSALFAGNDAFKFALAVFPYSDVNDKWIASSTIVTTDFTDLATFQVFLDGVNGDSGMGNEPNWDAVYEVGSGILVPLSWRPNSVRIIFMFTDEQGQSYRFPAVSEQIACDSLIHGEIYSVFSDIINLQDFNNCNSWFDIDDDQPTIEANMQSLIADPCR